LIEIDIDVMTPLNSAGGGSVHTMSTGGSSTKAH